MTTEPTTTWFDQLVPQEARDEGNRLLTELGEVRATISDLFARCARHFVASDVRFKTALAAIHEVGGPLAAHEISDGLGALVGVLDFSQELSTTLADIGVDVDALSDPTEDWSVTTAEVEAP